jgi:hypothetical protein
MDLKHSREEEAAGFFVLRVFSSDHFAQEKSRREVEKIDDER